VVSEDGVAFTFTGNRFRVAYQYAEMSAPGIGARVPGTALQVDVTPSAAFRFAAYGGLVRSGVVEETFDVAGLRRVTLSQVPTVGSLVLEVTLGDESWMLAPRQDYLRDGANVVILDPVVGYDDEGEGPILTARYVPLDAERSDVVLGAGVAADLGIVEVEAGVAYDERFRAVVNLATTLPGGGAGASLRLGENGLEAVQGSATLGAAWGDTRVDLELGLDEENRVTSNSSLVSDWSGGGVKLELATLADQLGVSTLTLQQRLGLLTASGTLEFDPVVGVAGDVSLLGDLLEGDSPLIARLGGTVGYRSDVGVRSALTLDAGISSSDAPIGVEVRSALGYDTVNGFLPTLGVHVDTLVADAVRLGLSQSVFGDRATRAALQVQRDGLEGVADVRYDWRDAAWRANVEAGGDLGPVRLDLAHVRTLSDDGVKVGTTLAATTQIDPAGGTSVGGSLRIGDGTVRGEVVANRTEGDVDMEVSYQVDPSAGPGRLALGVATPWNLGNGFEADVFGAVTLAASGSELRGGATLRYASDGVEADVGIDGATSLGSSGGRLNVTGGLLGRNDLLAAVADIDLRIVPTFEGTFGGAFRVDVPSGTTATVPGARFAPRGVIGYLDGDVADGATTMTVGVGTQVEVTTSISDGLSVRPSVAFRATWNDPLRPFALQPRLGVVQEFDLLGIQASAALYGQFLTRPAVGTFYTSASAELRIMPVDGVAVLFGYDTGETLLAPRGGGFRIGLEGHGIMRW